MVRKRPGHHRLAHGRSAVLDEAAEARRPPPGEQRVALDQPPARLRRRRLVAEPGDDLVQVREKGVEEADDDVLFGVEVVVQRRLGQVEPFGDLAERGLVVPLVGEQVERDRLDPVTGAAPSVRHGRPLPTYLLDARLVVSLPCGK
jgi:hypothetical protein